MSAQPAPHTTVVDHQAELEAYMSAGQTRALALGNRGPIRYDAQGDIHPDILEAYWREGFYVFENVIQQRELHELRADVDNALAGAPVAPGSDVNAAGGEPVGSAFVRDTFHFAKPLSDPLGGTAKNKGRHPVKMTEPTPNIDAPTHTIERIHGNLQVMDCALRLYGHHDLLSVAAAVNGPDFVPYNEVTFVKEPRLGVSVAWHRDGTTHWDAPDWDDGAHGFNFMAQLYPSTPGNGVWVLPGSHKKKDVDIPSLVRASGSERIDGAVPMVCDAGAVIISNRQLVHGSFANTSADRRITLNMGFFPRERVLGISTERLDGKVDTYDHTRVEERSRIIELAIDARAQHFPEAPRYRYAPLADRGQSFEWNEANREALLSNYNLQDMYI
ncbi:MAG: phytanoyl-CoA dioxygenase family protein [Gammaproteobacteria bacterium]|nr:phytanoyl-CoA dioxygenase family protein [Gammaproteobacteria bacterium]